MLFNYKMKCRGCDNTGYRSLCNYDDGVNNCGGGGGGGNLGQFSFKCIGPGSNQQCVRVNQPPGPGRYSNMKECERQCSTLGTKSYICSGTGYGGSAKKCLEVNRPPGPGRFSNMGDCKRSCGYGGIGGDSSGGSGRLGGGGIRGSYSSKDKVMGVL